mgnify:CR=1 FL=1
MTGVTVTTRVTPLRLRGRSRGHGAFLALCISVITSRGTLFYAFPVIAPTISERTAWSLPQLTAAFSAAQVVAAAVGIAVGRQVDRRGPRAVMTAASLVAVPALLVIVAAPDLAWFWVGWLLVGAAMAGVFYQPGFAALTRWYEGRARTRLLAWFTVAGGLASALFAPLAAALTEWLGWRGAFGVLALVLGVVTIPLHVWCLRRPWPPAPTVVGERSSGASSPVAVVRSRAFLLLTAALCLASFTLYAAVVNLVPLLTARGTTVTTAAWILGLGGLGEVLGRLLYEPLSLFGGMRGRTVVVLAAGGVTTAVLGLLPGPAVALALASLLAGGVRGIFVLVQATAVSERWGVACYAVLTAVLSAPVTLATAIAPWAGSVLAAPLGGYPTLFLGLAAVGGLGALLALGSTPPHLRARAHSGRG